MVFFFSFILFTDVFTSSPRLFVTMTIIKCILFL